MGFDDVMKIISELDLAQKWKEKNRLIKLKKMETVEIYMYKRESYLNQIRGKKSKRRALR